MRRESDVERLVQIVAEQLGWNPGHHGAWRAGNPVGLQQGKDQVDTGTAQDVAGLVHQVLATALLPRTGGR
jgi:hypothetical protein